MNIENAKTLFFTDKEHYLAFRKAWANAVNSPKAKSYLESCDEEIDYKISKGTGKIRRSGWITRAHVILYNLLREKNIENSFTPITNKDKLNRGTFINHGLYYGTCELTSYCTHSHKLSSVTTWSKDYIAKFLESFAGTVTQEMLALLKAKIPKITRLED